MKISWQAMALTVLLLAGLVWFTSAVSSILTPFIVGFVLAYLLNPMVVRLEKLGLGRGLASVVPVAFTMFLLGLFIALGAPMLLEQLAGFINRAPVYLMALEHFAIPQIEAKLGVNITLENFIKPLGMYGTEMAGWAVRTLGHLVGGLSAFVNVLSLLVITPLVAYYMLSDWPKITEKMRAQLPRSWRPRTNELLNEIDLKMAAYLRGTLTVCLILGTFYAVALSFLGLDMGWAVGLLTGIMSFIPIVGATLGVLLMYGLALMQFQTISSLPYILIGLIFVVGQILEGYVLTPRLVGNSVGLHPLWVIFALLAGGTLAGITGMLVAIPIAVVLSVIMPRILAYWRQSVR